MGNFKLSTLRSFESYQLKSEFANWYPEELVRIKMEVASVLGEIWSRLRQMGRKTDPFVTRASQQEGYPIYM